MLQPRACTHGGMHFYAICEAGTLQFITNISAEGTTYAQSAEDS